MKHPTRRQKLERQENPPSVPREAASTAKLHMDNRAEVTVGVGPMAHAVARNSARQALLTMSKTLDTGGYYTLTRLSDGVVIERVRLVPRGTPGAEGGRWLAEAVPAPIKKLSVTWKLTSDPRAAGFSLQMLLEGVVIGRATTAWAQYPGLVLRAQLKRLSREVSIPFIQALYITEAWLDPAHKSMGQSFYMRALREAKLQQMPLASGPEPDLDAPTREASEDWQGPALASYAAIVGDRGYFVGWLR